MLGQAEDKQMGGRGRRAMLSSVLVIATVLHIRSVVGDSRSEVVDIQPCSVATGVVSRSLSITYSLNGNFSLCPDPSYQALRVSTWSSGHEGDLDYPLVFVTRQGRAVDSWTIPFQPPDFTIGFDRVNRTLCYNNMTSVNNSLAYVDVFTSFGENISFNIVFDTVPNYTLQKDTWYPFQVGASTPQVHVFRFPDGVRTVTVQAKASSSRCAILSVQNVSCPINDLLEEIKSKGHHQTMSTDGFVTISRDIFKDSSFFVVLITTNYSECHSNDYVTLSPLYVNGTILGFNQRIDVIIRPLQSAPVLPILFPLLLFGVLYAITLVFIAVECLLKCRWSPPCKWEYMRKTNVGQDEDGERLVPTDRTRTSLNSGGDNSNGDTAVEDSLQLHVMEKAEKDLRLSHLCETQLKTLQSHYSVYSWNTVTVGIFYGLPAFQLVLSQQLVITPGVQVRRG
jgi:hypothetical protein